MSEKGYLGYEYQDDTLPYRKLMCAMIHNAIKNAQGETKAQLAREFGIHPTSVRDLVTA